VGKKGSVDTQEFEALRSYFGDGAQIEVISLYMAKENGEFETANGLGKADKGVKTRRDGCKKTGSLKTRRPAMCACENKNVRCICDETTRKRTAGFPRACPGRKRKKKVKKVFSAGTAGKR